MKAHWTIVAVLCCACAWAQGRCTAEGGCATQAQQQGKDQIPTFRSDVKLVNVYVTVVDKAGAPVGGLSRDDFEVFEDEVPQKVSVFARESEQPLSIVVALDTSLSTRKDLRVELDWRSTSSTRRSTNWCRSPPTWRASTAA
jgi:hypothetical protein